jgi:hypothetical protein
VSNLEPVQFFVSVDRTTVAEELWRFGEDALYERALEMTDNEMLRLWKLAGRLLWHDLARNGDEAAARAAITILEGADRPLARSRRRPRRGAPDLPATSEERFAEIQDIQDAAGTWPLYDYTGP